MAKTVKLSTLYEVLKELGFERFSLPPSGVMFRHEPTDTAFIFPRGRSSVTPQRIVSVRRVVVGRGVTTAKRFNELLGDVTPLALVG